MNIKELHYAFNLAKDRVDTLANQDFNIAEIDWFINEAALIFLKRRAGTNNALRKGFEADQKRIDDLSTLVIKYPVQPALTPVEIETGIYEVDLSDLDYTYFRYLSGKVLADIAPNCEKLIPLRFVQHDDYGTLFRDPFNGPSAEAIPYNFGLSTNGNSTSLFLYSGDDIVINEVRIDYIKYPSRVSYGTYTYLDGINYPEATLEFPEQAQYEIIDIATEVAAIATDSPEYIQLKLRKVSSDE